MAGPVTIIKANGVYDKNLTREQIAEIEASLNDAKNMIEWRGKQDPVYRGANTLNAAQSRAKKGKI